MLGLLGSGLAAREPYSDGFDANKLLNPGDTSKGTPASLNVGYLDAWIGELAKHAKNYPVNFDSSDEQLQAIRDITILSRILDTLDTPQTQNPELLRRAGFVNSMAHNLDVKGTASKAADYFSRLLKIAPDDAVGNQMFGAFLGSVGKPKEAIPYLRKADSLGVIGATYSLATAYLMTGEKSQAIEYFEKYRKAVPEDKSLDKLIEAVKNDQVEIQHTEPEKAGDFEAFANKMSNFYLAPSKESFGVFQKNAAQYEYKLIGTETKADLLVAVMIAKISQAHNWPIADTSIGKKAQDIVKGTSPTAQYVLDDTQVDPTKLDIWWASFSATGDHKYLENIFQVAGQEVPKEDTGRMLLVKAATGSFKSNCKQHKQVLEFARQKLKSPSTSQTQADFVKACIAFAETNGRAN